MAALRAGLPGLRSVTLDAPVDPAVSATSVLARDTWATVDQLSEACQEDAGCSSTVEDLGGAIVDGAAQLALEPGVATIDDAGTPVEATVDGDALVRAVAEGFRRHAGDIGEVVRTVAAATTQGDVAPIATQLLADARDTSRADVLAWTLRCAQDLAGATEYQHEGVPDAYWPLSGRLGDRDALVEACATFGVADAGGTTHDPVTSDIPVLTLSGEFDPWSTTSAADQVRDSGLTTSYGLVLPAIGHGTLGASPCALAVAGDFIADPTIEPDASCIADMAELTTGAVDPGASEGPDASLVPTPSEGPTAEPTATTEAGAGAQGQERGCGPRQGRRWLRERQRHRQRGRRPPVRGGAGGLRRAAQAAAATAPSARPATFLDIRDRVDVLRREGHPGLAFPPDYAETRLLLRHLRGRRPYLEPR